MRVLRKLAASGRMSRLITAGVGIALLATALCFAPVRANATVRKVTHAKTHATAHKLAKRRATNRRTTSRRSPHRVVRPRVASRRPAKAQRRVVRAKVEKAGLRNASYKTPTRKKWRKPYHPVRYRRARYRRRYRHHVTLPRAPASERTDQIQSALARGGYYPGNLNGKWDARTQDALRRFQAAKGLPATGKLDALSLQKLGLGSDVAGLSAPGRVMTDNQSSSQSSSLPGSSPGPRTPGH
ncbi:MAG TPA: peptidoglycan-binding domain-containing protein [Candidatus Acidoferrales bacterium]|nr:peptidoglycan-binding domain-containing protein [Candidatus Acidoferrales bacterium]